MKRIVITASLLLVATTQAAIEEKLTERGFYSETERCVPPCYSIDRGSRQRGIAPKAGETVVLVEEKEMVVVPKKRADKKEEGPLARAVKAPFRAIGSALSRDKEHEHHETTTHEPARREECRQHEELYHHAGLKEDMRNHERK